MLEFLLGGQCFKIHNFSIFLLQNFLNSLWNIFTIFRIYTYSTCIFGIFYLLNWSCLNFMTLLWRNLGILVYIWFQNIMFFIDYVIYLLNCSISIVRKLRHEYFLSNYLKISCFHRLCHRLLKFIINFINLVISICVLNILRAVKFYHC